MLAAAAVWIGALAGPVAGTAAGWGTVAAGIAGVAIVRHRVVVLLVLVGGGMISGAGATGREQATLAAAIPQGPGAVQGRAVTDGFPYGAGLRFVLEPGTWQRDGATAVPWTGPRIVVIGDVPEVVAGDYLTAHGLLRARAGLVRGDPVAGSFTADTVDIHGGASGTFMAAGNLFRARVTSRLARLGDSPAAALLAGFLIGDVSGLPQMDQESLRRAGLTHFVAVSGSNVALVLGAWWLVIGPFGAGSRLRAVTAMAVLIVFVVATRWEASVIRAATMAALGLGGRLVGISIDAWTALGGAVAILLAISGELAYDVGFQLSVVATAGVLAGMKLGVGRRPRLFWSALAATASAQAAVVPLLLVHFGTVPLLAPLANLLAAPLVTVATALAGLGVVVPWDVPLAAAEGVGGAVLKIAHIAGGWPQLDSVAATWLFGCVAASWKTGIRPLVLGAILVGGALSAMPPGPPSIPTLTILDVGQGDATLIREPGGGAVLVDGGRDPSVLQGALRRYGISRLELVVATHGDADHVGGLDGLERSVAIGSLWYPAHQGVSDLLQTTVDELDDAGIHTAPVAAGVSAQFGQIELEVLGPQRRYAAENDGSVVLWIEVGESAVLLPGDIGRHAQLDLPPLRPDVLLVPHHGAATSDLGWLEGTVGSLAVISVGPNAYGHPDPDVVGVVEQAGAVLVTTMESGDITIPLGP